MRTKRSLALLALPTVLVLQSCSSLWPFGDYADDEAMSSSSASSAETLTRYTDVSLQGTLMFQPGSATNYELRTPGGSVFALATGTTSYAEYEGKEVQIAGTLEESLDGSVRLLTVKEITEVVGEKSSSSEESSSSVASVSSAAVSSFSASSKASAASSKASVASVVSSAPAAASSASAPSTGDGSSVHSEEWLARAKKMSRSRGPEAWTQQYCSSHIGFCFPVRSDFWYRSFGAAAGSLWHVEISSEDILNLGDGPLVVDLVTGRLEGDLSDGLIREADGTVFGYRNWTNNRYMRVSAPSELYASVEIITKGIVPYEAPVQ